MFTNLIVENLRSLRHLEIPKLGRITLITGRNAAGKTTVLEALWLLSSPGHPGNALRLNGFRGLTTVEVPGSLGSETPWASLFSDYDATTTVTVSAKSKVQGREPLQAVRIREARSQRAVTKDDLGGNGSASTASSVELAMSVTGLHGFDGEYRFAFGPKAPIETPEPPQLPTRAVFMHARTDESVEAVGHRYSELVAQGRERAIVDALRLIEPKIEGLRLLTSGGPAVVYADVGRPHLIAMPLMGGGLWRLFGIVVDILWCRKDGLVLLDEAEYGIHFTVLPKLWKLIDDLSREHRVQVVATTHSRECIAAALQAQEAKLVKAPDDFVFLRLSRRSEDAVSAVSYEPETLEAALEGDIEVR